MKQLPLEIRRNKCQYFCLARTLKKAIYAQYYKDDLIGFEVFLIRVRANQKSGMFDRYLDSAEKFPTNENFGKTAWSLFTLEEAIIKYKQL